MMVVMTFNEFKELYKPVERETSKNFTKKYIYHSTSKLDREVIRLTYVKNIWTVLCKDIVTPSMIINGYKPANACGYIITEEPHNVWEEIKVIL